MTSPTLDRLANFTTRPRVVVLGAMAAVIILAGWFRLADDERRVEPGWLSARFK